MSKNYFQSFPTVDYRDKKAVNLLLRVGLNYDVVNPQTMFMPLTLNEYERAETVAFDMYNNSRYDWILRIINQQIDPYYDWYMSTEQFHKFIEKKYGSLEAAYSTILYYENVSNNQITVNKTTYDLGGVLASEYNPVYAYEHEERINEAKKHINTMLPADVDNFAKLLEKKLNE